MIVWWIWGLYLTKHHRFKGDIHIYSKVKHEIAAIEIIEPLPEMITLVENTGGRLKKIMKLTDTYLLLFAITLLKMNDDAGGSSPMELDSTVTNDDGVARVYENDETSKLKEEEEDDDCSEDQSSELGSETDEKELDLELKEEKRGVSNYKSLLYEFDDYVASEKMGHGVSRALSYGFEVGDLVWVRIDHVLVAFFGGSSYGWFDSAELIPLEPNLEEKSQQTVSKHFVRGVEEAMDEAKKPWMRRSSRMSALGYTLI
ncbi:unnamed protein product [Arabidopsis arenosa]|uniref:PWWP domain-containing protein n=1 Tax=Arabidopsis arenosa TaxID=38785 RepID=A0A8S1ZQ87_ARAAE|nr:unnamed protein product [Arabidopsis arenosa]